MKIFKKTLIYAIIILAVLNAFYFFWLSPRYVVPILMYHRFGYESGSLFVTPENFKRQMNYLKNKDYNVISLHELVRGIKSKEKFSRNTVVITVDDGFKDNFTYAYPVFKKHSFPAEIFIVAGNIGKKKEYLNWDEINTMLEDGISFGGHTKNHAYLPSVKSEKVLWNEIAGCKRLIERNISGEVDFFCYPIGGFNDEVKKIVKKAGYNGACTTNRGFAELNKDVYELKRIKIKNSDMNKPFSFRAKLSGYYNLFRSKKAGD